MELGLSGRAYVVTAARGGLGRAVAEALLVAGPGEPQMSQ